MRHRLKRIHYVLYFVMTPCLNICLAGIAVKGHAILAPSARLIPISYHKKNKLTLQLLEGSEPFQSTPK